MSRIVVLGAAGGIGRVAARGLATQPDIDEIRLADVDTEGLEELAGTLAHPGVTTTSVDATSGSSLADALNGADVTLNCIGPFYRYGPPVLRAAVSAGVDYVDVCDDLAPTRIMLDMDGAARAAGVTALIGMGNSPGIANVFARLCAEQFLDEVRSVDIMHVHGGEPDEGAAVIKHRIHAMTDPVPLFLDGRFVEVRQLRADGQAHVREFDFRDVGPLPVYPYPHPETITLPQHFPTLTRVTNLGVILPLSYFHRTQELVRVGACSARPLRVGDRDVVPLDVAVALLQRQRPTFLRDAGIDGPRGCLAVEVRGLKDGAKHRYVFQLSSTVAGAGEGTGIPAAVGATLMLRSQVSGPGVVPPEVAIDPLTFLPLAFQVWGAVSSGDGADRSAMHLEHMGPDGRREEIPLAF